MEVSITEAAAALQVSTQTIRRRLTNGVIKGYKRKTPQGSVWVVDLADLPPATPPTPPNTPPPGLASDDGMLVEELKARIDSLEAQLTTRAGEIDQLHRLLAQTALNAAPARPWWRFWR